ncbi:MAG: hypothetical protein IJ050_02945 [Clostridia bacterium]|nr:hypothetical protein [Clostridia bacterium]
MTDKQLFAFLESVKMNVTNSDTVQEAAEKIAKIQSHLIKSQKSEKPKK